MQLSVRTKLVIGAVLMLLLTSFGSPASAQPTGVYDLLTFPGAPGTCTNWSVNSTNGVNQPGPSNYVETMTDGLGNVVFSRSQTGGIGFFTFWGSGTFTAQPQANPIHELIVMDGVVIANIFADTPCLPGSARSVPALSPSMLVALAVLLGGAGMSMLRRRGC